LRASRRLRWDAPEAELAASCAQWEIDDAVRADFGAGPRRYTGDAAAIERAFRSDLARIAVYENRVFLLSSRFPPGPWLVGAHVTLATALDACRAGLVLSAPRARVLAALRSAEEKTARAYAEVALLGGAFEVLTPEVVAARRRLASHAARLGEPAMRALASGIVDPRSGASLYREGMFTSPPGLTLEGDLGPDPPPPAPAE
jgi:hypothetical protein